MKVLAIKLRQLGDTVLWTSALQALSNWSVIKEIDIAFPEPYKPLFAQDPRFFQTFPLRDTLTANLRYLPQLRKRHYDYVLNFHANRHSLILSLLSGTAKRIIHHHSRKPRNFLSNKRVIGLGTPMCATERDLNVLRTLGWEGKNPNPKIFVSSEARKKALACLKEMGTEMGTDPDQPLVILGMGASRPSKLWPMDRYLKLIQLIGKKTRIGIVYESDAIFERYQHLVPQLKERACFLHTPKLEDLMGYLTLASCYVGSDSGVKHLACALDIPTITLFGPESKGEWHSYTSENHQTIQLPVLCRNQDQENSEYAWCGESVCPLSSHACMTLIEPEQVAKAVEKMMSRISH